jgi:hypothetical protein
LLADVLAQDGTDLATTGTPPLRFGQFMAYLLPTHVLGQTLSPVTRRPASWGARGRAGLPCYRWGRRLFGAAVGEQQQLLRIEALTVAAVEAAQQLIQALLHLEVLLLFLPQGLHQFDNQALQGERVVGQALQGERVGGQG